MARRLPGWLDRGDVSDLRSDRHIFEGTRYAAVRGGGMVVGSYWVIWWFNRKNIGKPWENGGFLWCLNGMNTLWYMNIANWNMAMKIVDFPIQDSDFPVRYVKLLEGKSRFV